MGDVAVAVGYVTTLGLC